MFIFFFTVGMSTDRTLDLVGLLLEHEDLCLAQGAILTTAFGSIGAIKFFPTRFRPIAACSAASSMAFAAVGKRIIETRVEIMKKFEE